MECCFRKHIYRYQRYLGCTIVEIANGNVVIEQLGARSELTNYIHSLDLFWLFPLFFFNSQSPLPEGLVEVTIVGSSCCFLGHRLQRYLDRKAEEC